MDDTKQFGDRDSTSGSHGVVNADEALSSWLRSECEGAEEPATAWFAVTLLSLPLERPSAGFADRVLAQVFRRPESAVARLLNVAQRSPVARAATVATTFLLLLGAIFVPTALVGLTRTVGPKVFTGWVTEFLVASSGLLADSVGWIERLATVRNAFDSLLLDPTFLGLAGAALTVSFGAFACLHSLVVSERGKQYADI